MSAESAAPKLLATRLSIFYGAFFLSVGLLLPFWPVWLESRGLDAGDIGLILGLGVGLKVLTNPLAAFAADRLGERRRPMIALSLVAFGTFSLFLGAEGFWAILGVSLLVQGASPPVMPLGETLSMLAARRHGVDYSRVRLWGSLTFIAAAVGAGWAVSRAGIDVLYWLGLAAFGLAAAACWLLPDLRPERTTAARPSPWQLLRDGRFMLFVASCACVQGSHGVYYGFATLDWKAAGLSETVIGWLWAEGVIAEILLFAVGGAVVARVGPVGMLILAALGGVLRWTVTATTVALPALLAVQALHALTFGAAHLGAIYFIARTAPPALSATAQALYAAIVAGLVMGLSLQVSGEIYALHGRLAYLAMGLMCLGGAALGGVLLWRYGEAKGD